MNYRRPFTFRPVFSEMVSRFSDCGHDPDGDFSKGNTCATKGKTYTKAEQEANRQKVKDYYANKKLKEQEHKNKGNKISNISKTKSNKSEKDVYYVGHKGQYKYRIMGVTKEEQDKVERGEKDYPEEYLIEEVRANTESGIKKYVDKKKKSGDFPDTAEYVES